MKTRSGMRIHGAVLILISISILACTSPNQAAAQTTMGILPVNVSSVSSSVLNANQWQVISLQLHDYLVMQLTGIGNMSKLSREHILLLLKEIPGLDPENLDAEAYKIISKKEKLHYLLKCSVESIRVTGFNVIAPVSIIIVDGNTGNVFWEDIINSVRIISGPDMNEHILLNDVLKPSVDEISKEITALKY
jgi:hypothetical protein